jgi:hypothetical protein
MPRSDQPSSVSPSSAPAVAYGNRHRLVRKPKTRRRWRPALLALGWLTACSPGVSAKVLLVGPERTLQAPSDAAAVAEDGDVVRIDPGEYVDCAIWRANRLVLEAPDGAVHVRDRTCAGKGIWVISGADVTVDHITFSGAHVPDQNGAGIRAEGKNLTVRSSHFFDNENGILGGTVDGSTILIEGSAFERNGKCAANCAHGVYVNGIDRLKVVDSVFREQRQGHHIKSGARALQVIGSTIEDGPDGTASHLIDVVSGGEVLIADNVMEKGPQAENWGTAIHIGGEGTTQDAAPYRVSGNRFRSDNPHEVAFVRNQTVVPAALESNQIEGAVVPLVGPGTVDAGKASSARAVAPEQPGSAPHPRPASEPPSGPGAADDLEARLRLLKRLFEQALITEQEYSAKKADLLDRL